MKLAIAIILFYYSLQLWKWQILFTSDIYLVFIYLFHSIRISSFNLKLITDTVVFLVKKFTNFRNKRLLDIFWSHLKWRVVFNNVW